ncbi:nucleoside recognition domain-containing protein [Agathobaculum sp.]|uniref:nucleoside recognition domain-containing protein n=1 Tax=Agathobaculum sp. TaxID=2048138 RepID=UPI002A835BA2|nr:nucleoside recognition domain-containing protein [Agathobaculum sp.]MDY3617523.1 hypothetical protein [Agathobaculum sp.]
MKNPGALLLAAAMTAAFLLCPAESAQGVRDGLALAAGQALPALFPFFVASGLLTRTGAADMIARLLARPLALLYGLPPAAAPAVALGLVGGYPVGAATVADLLKTGAISRDDAARTVSFCNCASPAFCVGLCGLALFGSARAGWMLYFFHALAALLAGLFVARGRTDRSGALRPAAKPSEGFAAALCGATQSAAQTALTVTAFIVLFSILLRLLHPILETVPGGAAFSGLLELTCGLDHLRGSALPSAVLLPIVSLLLGFGGLSVHCQARALLAPYSLDMRRFTLGKALHGLFAAGMTLAWCLLSPSSVPAMVSLVPSDPPAPIPALIAAWALLFIGLFPNWGGKKSDDAL